jgi:hypothetical protein
MSSLALTSVAVGAALHNPHGQRACETHTVSTCGQTCSNMIDECSEGSCFPSIASSEC